MYPPQITPDELRAVSELLEEASKNRVANSSAEAEWTVVREALAACIGPERVGVSPVADLFVETRLNNDLAERRDVRASQAVDRWSIYGEGHPTAS